MKTKTDSTYDSISNLIGAANILKIVFNIDDFLNWLDNHHADVKPIDILPGYKFFIESGIGTFADRIHLDNSLNITEDFVYHRATHFADINLNKIPVTCQKTALMKNIQKMLRLIKKANSFQILKKETISFSKEILSHFDSVFEEHCEPKTELNYHKSINYSSRYVSHIFLSDLSKGVPLGYLLNPLAKKMSGPEFEKSFLGYKIGLQYLWFTLLEGQFGSSGLEKLHEATDWTHEYDWSPINHQNEKGERTDLDTYFSIIQDNIMEPLENQWPSIRNNQLFRIKGRNPKKHLNPLFSFKQDLNLSKSEQLKNELLWYDIELLASQSAIFNGVPAFITLLAGIVEIKSKFAQGEKAIICKFTHPRGKNQHDYTYGVLIESHSWMADYSGWILSFDCCGDYSGFAGSHHAMAEALIQHYQKQKKVSIRKMVIDKKEFEKYVIDNVTSGKKKDLLTSQLEAANIRRVSQEKLAEAQGLILELITYYTLQKRNYRDVDWNITVKKNQLDLICQFDQSIRLFECKVDPQNLNLKDEFEKIIEKFKSLDPSKKKYFQFWFYYRPTQDFFNKFKDFQQKYTQEDIVFEDYEVISEILYKDEIWRKKKLDKIINIFNSDFLKNSKKNRTELDDFELPSSNDFELFSDNSSDESIFGGC